MSNSRPRLNVPKVNLILLGTLGLAFLISAPHVNDPVQSWIVQGSEVTEIVDAVRNVGGTVTHELGIIHAVAAELSLAQVNALRRTDGVRVHENHVAKVCSRGGAQNTFYPTLVGADVLHQQGIDGHGVTVAVLDTGLGGTRVWFSIA